MWESLHGSSVRDNDDRDQSSAKEETEEYTNNIPVGFGRGRGAAASGRGRGRGRGIDKDLKGKDWECGSCSNINWSWRSTCNKCNSAKPVAITVSFFR
jgi:hypothetical protein